MDAAEQALDVTGILNRVFEGEALSRDLARKVMGMLMDGDLSQMQAAALLAALRTRGETPDEIVGFAQAMRERAVPLPIDVSGPLLDTCGTGGTGLNTINISTTSMFVIAASGALVAKHGNRGFTRRSGSADLLEELGADLDASPERLAGSLRETGVTFIYARNHHPAMKFVAPVRSDLKARTVFNSLGPLTSPAAAQRHVLGVYSPDLTEKLAHTLAGLGVEHALVVHGDGLDDLTVSGETKVSELHPDGRVETYVIAPEDFGLKRAPLEAIQGGDAATNARKARQILAGELDGAPRDVVLLSAGAGIYVAGQAGSLAEGVSRARELLDSGAALARLEQYLAYNRA